MKAIGGAAIAAIIVASTLSGAALAQEARITVHPTVWSDSGEMEALHTKVRRMAREMCKVPGASFRSITSCIDETESAAMLRSGNAALIAHYQDCRQARARRSSH